MADNITKKDSTEPADSKADAKDDAPPAKAHTFLNSVEPLPLIYSLFFLYIEPVATFSGAYMAWAQQDDYMRMTHPTAANSLLGVSTVQSIVLTQLANLYFVFALNEAWVLRATKDRDVWKQFLIGLLIADFGHLWSVNELGWNVYWEVWNWNAMYWGNLGFVYVGAALRMAFIAGIGLPEYRRDGELWAIKDGIFN